MAYTFYSSVSQTNRFVSLLLSVSVDIFILNRGTVTKLCVITPIQCLIEYPQLNVFDISLDRHQRQVHRKWIGLVIDDQWFGSLWNCEARVLNQTSSGLAELIKLL